MAREERGPGKSCPRVIIMMMMMMTKMMMMVLLANIYHE